MHLGQVQKWLAALGTSGGRGAECAGRLRARTWARCRNGWPPPGPPEAEVQNVLATSVHALGQVQKWLAAPGTSGGRDAECAGHLRARTWARCRSGWPSPGPPRVGVQKVLAALRCALGRGAEVAGHPRDLPRSVCRKCWRLSGHAPGRGAEVADDSVERPRPGCRSGTGFRTAPVSRQPFLLRTSAGLERVRSLLHGRALSVVSRGGPVCTAAQTVPREARGRQRMGRGNLRAARKARDGRAGRSEERRPGHIPHRHPPGRPHPPPPACYNLPGQYRAPLQRNGRRKRS
jgi:hypothetical protein